MKAKKRGGGGGVEEKKKKKKKKRSLPKVWILLDFSTVLSMETKSFCMVCIDGYGLV